MLNNLLTIYRFNLNCLQQLSADLEDEKMCRQPNGVVNHAKWTLGHMVMASDHLAVSLGLEKAAPEAWSQLFDIGSTPRDDPSIYPTKDEILSLLSQQHARVGEALEKSDPQAFEAPNPVEGLRGQFPTAGDLVTYLLTAHEGSHVGQLICWRRAMGLPPHAA